MLLQYICTDLHEREVSTTETLSATASIVPMHSEQQMPTAAATDSSFDDQQADILIVTNQPNQPLDTDVYPPQDTGTLSKAGKPKFRYMNVSWYTEYTWLHWNSISKKLYCFFCVKAKQHNMLISHRNLFEPTFIESGFCDWKNAMRAFERHDKCDCHREAVDNWQSISNARASVSAQLNKQLLTEQHAAAIGLSSIITSILFLARQGLALRGHTEMSGNLFQLMLIRSHDIPELKTFMQKRDSYLSHDIQNEIVELMAHQILRSLMKIILPYVKVGSKVELSPVAFFSIIVDETTDVSTKEQVSICLRWVSEDLMPCEDFLGLYETSSTTGETLTDVICDVLTRFGLPTARLRGQCYDGASNMSGSIKGVRSRIQQLQPKALYVHCFAHTLNLSVQDAVRSIPFVRDVMQNLRDLATIVRGSAKRLVTFKAVADGFDTCDAVTPRPLCPTRWTVRFTAIDAALKSYMVLMPYLSEVACMATVDDSSAKASGLQSVFENGQTLLSLYAVHQVFGITDGLSCSLQSASATVCGSIEAVLESVNQLRELRSELFFSKLWKDVQSKITEYGLQDIMLPRHVNAKTPSRYSYVTQQRGSKTSTPLFQTAEDYFRVQFFAFLDAVIEHITSRFLQPELNTYCNLESLLLSACRGEDYVDLLDKVCQVYDEFDKSRLGLQLAMLQSLCCQSEFPIANVTTFATFFRRKPSEVKALFGQVDILLRLLLVVPASSATAERSFSCLRRLKTYLRSTMSQSRLNHLTVLHVHQDKVDALDLRAIFNDFVAKNDHRKDVFGNFGFSG